MGWWAHPLIGFEKLVSLAGAFLDMLILASGYQSTGDPVLWQPQSVKRALEWATMFEDLMAKFLATKEGETSKEAFDLALLDLMDATPHPPGLPVLSSSLLAEARKLLVSALTGAFGIGNGQLVPVIVLASELDKESTSVECSHANQMRSRKRSFDKMEDERPENLSARVMVDKFEEGIKGQLFSLVVQQLKDRYSCKTLVESLSRELEITGSSLAKGGTSVKDSMDIWKRSDLERNNSEAFLVCHCEQWARESLLYMTSAETMYKLMGGMIIFKSESAHWTNVFEQMLAESNKHSETNTWVDIAELCCLCLASESWRQMQNKLLNFLHSYPVLSSHNQLSRYFDGWWEESASACGLSDFKWTLSMKDEVEKYLLGHLRSKEGLCWNLPPIIAAFALRHGTLAEHYIREIEKHAIEKESSGLCSCHSCCNTLWCKKCLEDVFQRIWCISMLNDDSNDKIFGC